MRHVCLLIFLSATWSVSGAQTPNRTPQKIHEDSLEAARFEKRYPERYRFNRAPWVLEDSSVFIQGYQNAIQLQYNDVVDSIHNNFHSGMPDTTTVTPYSSISVAGSRVKVYYASCLLWDESGTGSITPMDLATMKKDSAKEFDGSHGVMGIPNFLRRDILYIRLTLNGRPISDWTRLSDLPPTLCKGVSIATLRGKNYPPFRSVAYTSRYLICDTALNLHDQLLIEIKESVKNWMLDRFNITRVSASPTVDAIRVTGEDGRSTFVSSPEKKTSGSDQVSRTSR